MAFLKLTLVFAPALFMGLHVFVSLLQAYIFTLLTMIYVASAVAHEALNTGIIRPYSVSAAGSQATP